MDVDAVLKDGSNRIATLDLAKAFDKVNRKTVHEDYKKVLNPKRTDMLLHASRT